MGRAIAAVIAGYVTMFVVIFATFTGAYLAMGADRAFKPGTYEVSTLWIGAAFALGLIAALLGGVVCRAIAKVPKQVVILAGVVMLLGALTAYFETKKQDPGPRTVAVSNMEAMTKAVQPRWITLANPILGAVGVMLGGRAFSEGTGR